MIIGRDDVPKRTMPPLAGKRHFPDCSSDGEFLGLCQGFLECFEWGEPVVVLLQEETHCKILEDLPEGCLVRRRLRNVSSDGEAQLAARAQIRELEVDGGPSPLSRNPLASR